MDRQLSPEVLDTALAISELADGEIDQLRTIEGHLLTQGSADKPVSPASIASESDLSATTARDICRQLAAVEALEQTSTPANPRHSEYKCNVDRCVNILETAVTATRVIRKDRKRRQPVPRVEPLATLPADPSFSGFTPQEMGFDWLMPRLSAAINSATSEVRILMPFFEKDGFETLHPDLSAALDRGVNITIVTRYLTDTDSHNFDVLSEFIDQARATGVPVSNLRLVDYTPQTEDGTQATQEGPPPAFTLHAKVMAFDEESVYVGSANVTDYGFERYLELGVLVSGPPAESYRKIIDRLLDSPSAQTVDL